ncbi:MAG: SAVED domain-containing protein [Muribaculaceae bacterium]|nr:SAVED domain-containing protein [Muribaculaceae bacterium]MCM1439442.1 SAVED domain-containing protein [Roseburia sp.]
MQSSKYILEKSKSMLLEIAKKGFELFKSALQKFKIQSYEIAYITAEADNLFSEYMENGLYDKIDSICEDDLFDRVVDYSLNSPEYNIDEFINSLLDKKEGFQRDDRQAVIAFFHRIREIILKAQITYEIKDTEHKVLSKQVQAVQASLDANLYIKKQESERCCFIGILACESNDSRTRELIEFPENNLLNLTEYICDFSNVQEIIDKIERFKNQLDNNTIYKVKLACNYSLAFLTGAVFSQKTSNLIFINRNNKWSIGQADKIKLHCKSIQKKDGETINVAITLGTTSYIDEDVRSFIGENQSLISIHYDNDIQTSGQFNALGNAITKKLKEIARVSVGPLNLFYRGPAEIMFLLGQKSNDFGQCTIYEYGFKEREIQKRTYVKGVTY